MNRTEAKDAVYGHANTAWDVACTLHGIGDHAIRFKDDGKPEPAQGTPWARVSMAVVDEYQEALRNQTRRFVTVGNVFVQIFLPRINGKVAVNADLVAEDVRNAFRDCNVSDHLEFTAATIDDNVPQASAWLAVNIVARYWYRQFI